MQKGEKRFSEDIHRKRERENTYQEENPWSLVSMTMTEKLRGTEKENWKKTEAPELERARPTQRRRCSVSVRYRARKVPIT
jgi:hypothetical protein